MALYLLGKILVHNAAPSSLFNDGDVIDVYYNDATLGVVVYKDGVQLTYDPGYILGLHRTRTGTGNFQIIDGISSHTTVNRTDYAISAYSFCISTILTWFKINKIYPEFPYFQKLSTINSPVCDAGQACDIQWQGPVVVIHTTSLTTPNGSIQGLATSDNGVVKYGLTDFHYDSEGQLSGLFSNLGIGTYTIYAKDANDCTVQVTVTVIYKPQEEEHYRCTFRTLETGAGPSRYERIRIYEREYVGSLVEVDYASGSIFEPLKPKQGEINDKFFPVHPTQAILSLVSKHNGQWLPLYTQDDKKYRVVREFLEDTTWTPIWQGYINPSTNQENFTPGYPSTINFQMSDNVKQLEAQPFRDGNGNLIQGNMKIIKIIAHILKLTGLNLKIRCGINIFEITHAIESDGSSDPLDQTYINTSSYINEDGEPLNCWQVLEALLRPFLSKIYQEDGMWCIEEIDRATADYDYRIFDANGDYESNGTYEPLMSVKNPDQLNRVALAGSQNHSQEIIPAYGQVDVIQKLNYVGSFPTGGFEKKDLLSPNAEVLTPYQGVYTTEEGFRGWTLRLNGTTGVNFGRVQVGITREKAPLTQRDGTVILAPVVDRNAIRVDSEDRSVGAFFFGTAWDGNVRDAYVESKPEPYQYGPSDSIKFRFEYAAPGSTSGAYEFIVLRYAIKLGGLFLQHDNTWSATECIRRAYPAKSAAFELFELDVPTPETTVVVDTVMQLRIYFYAKDFYDFGLPSKTTNVMDGTDGTSEVKAVSTVGVEHE
jgi:hypothetical protein